MSVLATQKALLKESLFQFVVKTVPGADLELLDDIFLSYVISFIEVPHNCFDAEGFVEMMTDFIPGFKTIEIPVVCSWVENVVVDLTCLGQDKMMSDRGENESEKKMNTVLEALSEMHPVVNKLPRSRTISENSEGNEGVRRSLFEDDEHASQCGALHEMFPNSCAMEIKHCVSIANGDVERAAAILLHRREQGQEQAAGMHPTMRQPLIDDHELKNRIIARYSYVDKDSGNKEHKPLAPKIAPKKLVRYRDNKIVSLKGERYTE